MTQNTGVACTLTAADLAAQSQRWETLLAGAMTIGAVAETADGLRISFRPGPGAEQELRALIAVEAQCCAWATWTLERTPEAIILEVRSTAEGIIALHTMFTSDQVVP